MQAGIEHLNSYADEAGNVSEETTELVNAGSQTPVMPDAALLQLPLPTGGNPNVTPAQFTSNELAFANEISVFRDAYVQGPPTPNYPGIDGWIDGVPMSIKQVGTTTPRTVLNRAAEAIEKARNNGYAYQGVECFIEAPNISSAAMNSFCGPGTALRRMTGAGRTLSKITIFCQDGVIVIG